MLVTITQEADIENTKNVMTSNTLPSGLDPPEDAIGSFISDWEVITMEDVIVRRNARHRIQQAVFGAVDTIITEEGDEEEEDDENDEGDELRPHAPSVDIESRIGCVKGFIFPIRTFQLLLDRGLLPTHRRKHRLKYELEENRIIVYMASPAHDAAANAWNVTVALWSTNSGLVANSLSQMGQGQWRWAPGADKSPDQSFTPFGLTMPPARLIPGTISLPYPNMVWEVAKTHESFDDLFRDAEQKHFSAMTTVRVWIGIKLFEGYGGRMRCVFRTRDLVNNGFLLNSGATTGFISLHQPANIEFIIPKGEVYWGIAPPLPTTQTLVPGANALRPPPVAGIPTDDLILPLEQVRVAALRAW